MLNDPPVLDAMDRHRTLPQVGAGGRERTGKVALVGSGCGQTGYNAVPLSDLVLYLVPSRGGRPKRY